MTNMKTVAFSGVPKRGETLCRPCQPGKRWSRDIAQTSRTPVIRITMPQAKIAMTTSTSRPVPTIGPSDPG